MPPKVLYLPLHRKVLDRISKRYRPILTMDGEQVRLDESTGSSGPCGTEEAASTRTTFFTPPAYSRCAADGDWVLFFAHICLLRKP